MMTQKMLLGKMVLGLCTNSALHGGSPLRWYGSNHAAAWGTPLLAFAMASWHCAALRRDCKCKQSGEHKSANKQYWDGVESRIPPQSGMIAGDVYSGPKVPKEKAKSNGSISA